MARDLNIKPRVPIIQCQKATEKNIEVRVNEA